MNTLLTDDPTFFDADKEKNSSKKYFGQKEVPNVRINCLDPVDYEQTQGSCYMTTLEGYYEEHDTHNGKQITISTPVISLQDYELLTHTSHFTIDVEEILRAQDNSDQILIRHVGNFNNINIKHKVYSDGEPTVWYITFSHRRGTSPTQVEILRPLKDDKEPKKHQLQKLRKVQSDTLGEVQL